MLPQAIIGESRDDCGKKCGNAGTRFSKSELFGGFPDQIWWKPCLRRLAFREHQSTGNGIFCSLPTLMGIPRPQQYNLHSFYGRGRGRDNGAATKRRTKPSPLTLNSRPQRHHGWQSSGSMSQTLSLTCLRRPLGRNDTDQWREFDVRAMRDGQIQFNETATRTQMIRAIILA